MNTEPAESTDVPSGFDRTQLRDQLSLAADLRCSQDQVLWSIFGSFWGANTVLLVALFATGTLPANPFVGIVVSLVGIFLSFTWYIIQGRSIGHLELLYNVIERLERKLEIPKEFAVSGGINVSDYGAFIDRFRIKARTLMRACCGLAGVGWFVAFVCFIWR